MVYTAGSLTCETEHHRNSTRCRPGYSLDIASTTLMYLPLASKDRLETCHSTHWTVYTMESQVGHGISFFPS